MIFDCFTFYNELEILDIRLNELDKVVDKFVLVEGSVTFTNKPKKLYFQENKHLFKKFLPKIIHVVVKDSPQVVGNPWIIEEFQFNAMLRGLIKAKDTDTVMLSCVDEIPKAEKVKSFLKKRGHNVFLQKLCYYFLNNVIDSKSDWQGTMLMSYKKLLSYQSPYIARYSKPDTTIQDGGWHFSNMGGVNRIRDKIMSFSHQEFNNPTYNTPEKIYAAILSGKDLYGRGFTFKILSLDFLPQYVKSNLSQFRKLLINPEKKYVASNVLIMFLMGLGIGRSVTRFLLRTLGLRK